MTDDISEKLQIKSEEIGSQIDMLSLGTALFPKVVT
jgi:hypothetical protein